MLAKGPHELQTGLRREVMSREEYSGQVPHRFHEYWLPPPRASRRTTGGTGIGKDPAKLYVPSVIMHSRVRHKTASCGKMFADGWLWPLGAIG